MDDLYFMKRALDLARQGLGLVSPNPTVGAVLVSSGQVLGEGYHRYDWLRHAESYAIEKAGARARRATLYCTLEPCCHQGRTPPCTDSLIEAGIGRAVIAVVDPDPRVAGRGIDQLRAAGIAVELGLCQSEALRLNESYFKFVTRGVPFAHAVIERQASTLTSGWNPSRYFLASAAHYDGLVLGDRGELNEAFLASALGRERHRPLVVAGPALTLSMEGMPASFEYIARAPRDLPSLLEALAGLRVTSALILPGALDLSGPSALESIDKLTFVDRQPGQKHSGDSVSARNRIEAELHMPESNEAGEYIETTGYLKQLSSI